MAVWQLDSHSYSPPVPPFGFDDSQISIFAEVPDSVVPREFTSTTPLIWSLDRRIAGVH